jgi:hypothetical protein
MKFLVQNYSNLKRQLINVIDQRLTIRRKLNMPLESAVNLLDDATHSRLDNKVLATVEEAPTSLTLTLATLLLTTIASNSDGTVDSKYRETPHSKALIQEYADLQPELLSAWEAKDFKEIRSLSTSAPYIALFALMAGFRNSLAPTRRRSAHV